jgi:hypothetical protein
MSSITDISNTLTKPEETVFDVVVFIVTIFRLVTFLAIFVIIKFILNIIYGKTAEGELSRISFVSNLSVFLVFIIPYIMSLSSYSIDQIKTFQFSDALKVIKVFIENPYFIFTQILFLIMFYTIIYFLSIPMQFNTKPIGISIVETLTILSIIGLLIFDFFKYVLHIDLFNFAFDSLFNKLHETSSTTSPDDISNTTSLLNTPNSTCPGTTTPPVGEVFNIRNNMYTYDEARQVCSIYGAKLATYNQIEKAYNDGAEWCNYGWSEGQMALFPTQKDTWNAMQPDRSNGSCSKVNNKCGRPGINGGIIKNPNVRFGVNCYGKKPAPSAADTALMKSNVENKQAETPKDLELQAKMKVWKENADKYLLVNSFNKTKWSEDK